MNDSADNRKPTRRFSDRVDYYVRYRPAYPPALLRFLEGAAGLTPQTIVADVGSGTGILSQLFLVYGCPVYGIEPNPEMRAAAEASLREYPHFTSVAATAEATTLPTARVDLVTVGQALHWFDLPAARQEFGRILRPGGHAAIVYNDWRRADHSFAAAYAQVLRTYGLDYEQTTHVRVEKEEMRAAFFPAGYQTAIFENDQEFDFAGLRGRVLSASYAPLPGHPNYEPMMAALHRLFDEFAQDGLLHFPYETHVDCGRLDA